MPSGGSSSPAVDGTVTVSAAQAASPRQPERYSEVLQLEALTSMVKVCCSENHTAEVKHGGDAETWFRVQGLVLRIQRVHGLRFLRLEFRVSGFRVCDLAFEGLLFRV